MSTHETVYSGTAAAGVAAARLLVRVVPVEARGVAVEVEPVELGDLLGTEVLSPSPDQCPPLSDQVVNGAKVVRLGHGLEGGPELIVKAA